uniref:Uncharacterized protein n=1 Tax=Physcomitrium patens TaxID=3218 RepID=A0A2K1JBC3_PHYPA|nr:hypothetical protein PHYPA_019113 [Physcomitrium patens]
MLGALPKSYDAFVQVVLCQDELPKFEKLCGKLLLEEARREGDGNQNEALSVVKATKHIGTFYRGQRTYFQHLKSKNDKRWISELQSPRIF